MSLPIPFSRAAAFIAASFAVAAPAAHAQAFDAVRLRPAASGQDSGAVGLVVLSGARYMGSDERRLRALPVLDYQWGNGWFAGFTNGVGYNFSTSPGMQYGLRVTADLGRKESRSIALNGMGDIDPSAEFGGFFNYSILPGLSLTSSLRYGSGDDHKGLVADLGAGYSMAIAPQWRLSIGAGLTATNADYMQSYFGVTPAQSATSGYGIYTPKAGLRDVRTSAALSYQISRDFTLTGGISASTLLGDAADSPLTRQKSTINGLMAVTYSF